MFRYGPNIKVPFKNWIFLPSSSHLFWTTSITEDALYKTCTPGPGVTELDTAPLATVYNYENLKTKKRFFFSQKTYRILSFKNFRFSTSSCLMVIILENTSVQFYHVKYVRSRIIWIPIGEIENVYKCIIYLKQKFHIIITL